MRIGKFGAGLACRHASWRPYQPPQLPERRVGITHASGRFNQRVQNRRQIERRSTDRLEDIRGGGLLLKGLCQVTRARLHFVKQTDVLDRNHRLVGEGLGQLDLFVGERFRRPAH